MPYTVNGFGTSYFGQSNIHRIRSQCEFCNRIGVLESYDTTLFITALFIPLIPIGKKRILDKCPTCTKHRALSLADWNQAKQDKKAELLENLQNNPNDKDSLVKALNVSIGYQDKALFHLFRETLINESTDFAEVQAALGDAHSFFGEPIQAIEAYQRSLALKDTPLVHENLGFMLLNQGKPDEAAPHLVHLLAEWTPDKLWLLQRLVVGYQADGSHTEALSLLDKVEKRYPETLKLREWVNLRKVSAKNEGSQKKIGDPNLVPMGNSSNRDAKPGSSRNALIGFAAVVLAFVLWHVATALYVGNNRKVHLVGALSKPYQVSLNGATVLLPPYQVVEVNLPEGEIQVEPGKDATGIQPGTVKLETSFWFRPYTVPVVVINPDKLAIFYVDTATYSENPGGAEPPPVYYCNELSHEFESIDYPFQPFPATLRLKRSEIKTRKAVGVVAKPTDQERLELITQSASPVGLMEYLPRWLGSDPNNPLVLRLTASVLPREKAVELLKTRLREKPIVVEWHRAYQDVFLAKSDEASLRPEYQKLAVDTGRDPLALYLLGRISPPDEGIALAQEAIKTGKPAPFSHYALGYHWLCEGKFQDAAKEMDQASSLFESGSQYALFAREAYLAGGRFDEIYRMIDKDAKDPNQRVSSLMERARYQALQGNKNALEETRKVILGTVSGPQETILRPLVENNFKKLSALASGSVEEYVQLNLERPGRISDVRLAILQGKPGDALSAAGENAIAGDPFVEKALLLLALPAGKNPEAEKLKESVLEEMGGRRDERLIQQMILKKIPFDIEKVRKSVSNPQDKRVVVHLAAKWIPEHAKELRELATKLDFQRDEVSLCLKKARP